MVSKLGGQRFLAPKNDYSRDPILELAQIAWPMPFLQQCQSVRSAKRCGLFPKRLACFCIKRKSHNCGMSAFLARSGGSYLKKTSSLQSAVFTRNNRFPSCSQGTDNPYLCESAQQAGATCTAPGKRVDQLFLRSRIHITKLIEIKSARGSQLTIAFLKLRRE